MLMRGIVCSNPMDEQQKQEQEEAGAAAHSATAGATC